MFGIYRYLLALTVMHGHLVWFLSGQVNWVGWYAVWAFFVLSGYLMTRVLHETYGYSPRGTLLFAGNRVLRIYPTYWVAALLGLAILAAYPDSEWFGSFLVPDSASSWTRNFSILGMLGERRTLVPPAWSLHMELLFYGVIALGLSRTRNLSALWIVGATALTALILAGHPPRTNRLGSLLLTSFPFALGSSLFFVRRALPRWTLAVVPLYFVHAFLAGTLWTDVLEEGLYTSTILSALCVWVLAEAKPSQRLAKWDQYLGDLSYPFFLIHAQAAYTLASWQPELRSLPSLWLPTTLLTSHVLASGMHAAVEVPLERWRGRVRKRAVENKRAG